MNILVVEDDSATREVLTAFLARAGDSVQAAENVKHALELMRDVPPDVLVTDFCMPGMSALDLIQEIRARGHKTMPVIVVTAHASEEDAEQLLRAGASLLLTKPVALEQLRCLVEFAR